MVGEAAAPAEWGEIKTDDGTLWHQVIPLMSPASGVTLYLRAVSPSKDGAERLLRMKIHECFNYGDVVIARGLPRVEETKNFAEDRTEWRGHARFHIMSRPKPDFLVGFGSPQP